MSTADVSIAHVTVEVRRPATWRHYLATVTGDHARVSWDDRLRHGALRLREGRADDLVLLGLAFPDEAYLQSTLDRLTAAGFAWRDVAPSEGVRRAVRTADPSGTPLELLVYAARPPADEGWPIGHVALAHARQAELEGFYGEVLGFRLNQQVTINLGPIDVRGSFLGSAHRHHTVAVFDLPSRSRLHHVFFGAPDLTVVLEQWHRSRTDRVPLTLDLGRHALPDGTTSFYAESPSGFALEVGAGTESLDGRHLPEPIRGPADSIWGHAVSLRARLRVVLALLLRRVPLIA